MPDGPRPPAMDTLLTSAAGQALADRWGRVRAKEALRHAADRYRRGELGPGDPAEAAARLAAAAEEELVAARPRGLRPVVNATGVLLHTNLGRAPLAAAALDAVRDGGGFCTLEYDLVTGGRGRRDEHVRPLLVKLFAPSRDDLDALAVTNAAAALLLALDTVANGRPVAVSSGELVAIGGDFRVPSILAKSGASLYEVGTTNRTTRADYEDALRAGVAAILKVRPSNYRIIGFTEDVPLAELAALARARGVPLLYDAGAGAPRRFTAPGLADEPVPLEAIEAGADLVCFSGDKVLGGPQAGILLGRRDLVARAAANPLSRALRPDKLVLAALAATLDLHLAGRENEIPFYRMLAAPVADLTKRAEALAAAARAAGWTAEAVASTAVAGGGTGEGSTLPSAAVALRHPDLSSDELAAAFRAQPLPIIARIADGRVLLDLRTVDPEEDAAIRAALSERLS
jgi:L-seryl-tRNA(Ser) seleniumtransferase